MTGADLEKTDTYLRMKMSPDSKPHYINDLVASLLQFVDQTDIRTQHGNNAPFNYRLVPYIAASDHAVFLAAGIPAMQFNHWPDNFYHSSEDRASMADPTEMKRVAFMGAAAFMYLANAGAARGARPRVGIGGQWREVDCGGRAAVRAVARRRGRQVARAVQAAQNKITWAFHRARGGVESVLELSSDGPAAAASSGSSRVSKRFAKCSRRSSKDLYRDRCQSLGIKPAPIQRSAAEQAYGRLVPRNRYKIFTEEARKRGADVNKFLADGPRLQGLAGGEAVAFIDGSRSILDIYDAVRAEYGNVTTSSNELKFAYVVTPETSDIDLEAVANLIRALEKAGLVEMVKR